jgi:DNA-3-methyladenine glycosylase II
LRSSAPADDVPPRRLDRATVARAAAALARRDHDLARLHARHGPPPLWSRPTGFSTLFRIILEQQVSLAAARTLFRRVEAGLGAVTASRVHAAGPQGLRELGLTGSKAAYAHGLAARLLDGRLDLRAVARAPDEAGRAMLLAVPGLGPWSVAIYQLMALRRPDVWPDGDLALAAAMRDVKGLRALPSPERQHALAAGWAPWRSVAARFLWAHYLATRGGGMKSP